MITFMDTLVTAGLFALRFCVPVAVTALLVYLLKRLDWQYETEARAQAALQPAAAGMTVGAVPRSTRAGREARSGSQVTHKGCEAFAESGSACWEAYLEVDGQIPEKCPRCEIFQRHPIN